jgi:aspartyl/glutamyl-tRNA(Asn/Gln) amidotransferase C subunit
MSIPIRTDGHRGPPRQYEELNDKIKSMNKNSKKIAVNHLVRLANLKISPREKAKIVPQLEETIDYFSILKQVKGVDQEKPTFQVTDNTNITAEDKVGPCLPKQKILGQKKYFTIKNQ